MASPEPIPGKCGSKLPGRTPTVYCERSPMKGRTRCSRHGGKSKRGAEHPNYQGKGRSVDIPTRLADRWRNGALGREDPELTSQRKALGLLDERLGQLLERLETNEAGKAWDRIADAYKELSAEMRAARRMGDLTLSDWFGDGGGTVLGCVDAIGKALTDSRNERDTWFEIYKGVSVRGEMADTEHRRDTLAHKVMTDRESQALVGALQLALVQVADVLLSGVMVQPKGALECVELRPLFLRGIAQRFQEILYANGPAAVGSTPGAPLALPPGPV